MAKPKSVAPTGLAHTILTYRTRAGLSQQQLADALGISRNIVARWEISDRSPRTQIIPRLAAVLGCTVGELFGEKKAKKSAG